MSLIATPCKEVILIGVAVASLALIKRTANPVPIANLFTVYSCKRDNFARTSPNMQFPYSATKLHIIKKIGFRSPRFPAATVTYSDDLAEPPQTRNWRSSIV
jgi:hypothetical protein